MSETPATTSPAGTSTPLSEDTAARDAATRAHFTARAASYAGSGDESLRAMIALGRPQPGERVLDVATGTGLVLFAFAQAVGPAGMAIGVDFTPAMLAQAVRRRANAGAAVEAASPPGPSLPSAVPVLLAAHATRLPFAPASFDVVTCRFSIHHFGDAAGSVRAMAQALRPGGRLVVADFVLPAEPEGMALYLRLERLRGHQFVELYPQARLEAMLAEAGCPVTSRQAIERETRVDEWLSNPNVTPTNRDALTALVEQVRRDGPSGLSGLRLNSADGAVLHTRSDTVLVGVKRG